MNQQIFLDKEYFDGYLWIIANSRSGHNFIKSNIESWFGDRYFYVNLEGEDPQNFLKHETANGISSETYSLSLKVVCIRDLLNWYASSAFIFMNDKENLETFDWLASQKHIINAKKATEVWLKIAKEFLGVTNYMNDSVGIYYDEFFFSREYRKSICNKLGGEYNEKMLNFVTWSSFDGGNFQDRTQEMKVLERYKIWDETNEHRHILKILKDHEALEFYLDNFEVNDDKKRFIDKWIISN